MPPAASPHVTGQPAGVPSRPNRCVRRSVQQRKWDEYRMAAEKVDEMGVSEWGLANGE